MEWFSVSSAVTTSLAWAGADARARGAWVSLADVCRQTMTEGRISAARTQLTRVCRLARISMGDLRSAIASELMRYDADDLVLIGWDIAKEREAARAAQRARDHRRRQQPSHQPHALHESHESDNLIHHEDNIADPVREPYGLQNPYAHPNYVPEKTRRDQTIPENTSPPSPLGVTENNLPTRDNIPTVATTAAQEITSIKPDHVHEACANAESHEAGITPPRVREPYAYAHPYEKPHGNNQGNQGSAQKSVKSTSELTPKRSEKDVVSAVRTAALHDDALGVIVAMGGCLRGPKGTDYTTEWQREIQGSDARELLAINKTAAEPLRLPSGLRKERERWRQIPLEQRRDLVLQVCADYHIPHDKRPVPNNPGNNSPNNLPNNSTAAEQPP
jgi:hypothetical protein